MSLALLESTTAPDAQADAGAWLQTLSHLDPKFGGLTAVVPALRDGLRRGGMDARLAAFCAPQEHADASDDTSIWPVGNLRWLTHARLRARFDEAVSGVDGLHAHGLWEAGTLVATRAARKRNKPYVVSAHGMLEPWALSQKAWKKRLYGAWMERPALQQAACLHALTLAEADDYRRFGCTQPIAVIPNAVDPPCRIDESLIDRQFPELAGKRAVLFLGRLHRKKGVELLLEAWQPLRREFPHAVLVLAGPGEDHYVQSLQALVMEHDMRDQVLFTGMLNHAAKWSVLRRSYVFVLPSYSEGLSVAVLEALSVGLPAIVTDACHLPEITSESCGWCVPTQVQSLRESLRESLLSSGSEQQRRSLNARQLAAGRFSWSAVCAQMRELYACVLGGCRPQLCTWFEATR